MKKWTIATAAIATALLANGRAEAANCGNVVFSPTSVDFAQTWDPMVSPTAKTLTFNATVNSFNGGSKSIRIIFLDNNAGSPIRLGSAGPKYTVTAGAVTYGFPSGTSVTGQPEIMIPNGMNPSISLTLTVTIPANTSPVEDFVGGQVFSEPLKYTLQCLKNPGTTDNGTDSLQSGPTISLTIPKLVSITTASPQTINFGNFTTATQTLQVGVKSTSSINVAVQSGDQMVLAGAVQPYPTNSVIPYTMTLNGDTVANNTSLTNRTRATVGGTNWPLILTLTGGVPSGKLAGSYSDTITLTLTPGA